MDIEWFRDLSITVLGFGATGILLVLAIAFLRLQRGMGQVLRELKAASILARESAEMVRDGVEPIASFLGVVKAMKHGPERTSRRDDKRGR